jgi:ABC-2 type transport system permease protein
VLRNVFTKTLWDQRRALLAWALGVAMATAVYASSYRTYRSQAAELTKSIPAVLRDVFGFADLASPAGYLQATVFGIIVPLLLILFAAATGARAIAGDEEAGTLDLVLAHPVSRGGLALQRFAALALATLALGAVVLLVLLALAGPAGLEIAAGNLAAMVLHLVLLGICFGALALALGGIVGRRGPVLAGTAAIAVLAYFANTLAPQVDTLAWLRRLSPFYYYSGGEPLRRGLQFGDAATLCAIAAVLVAVGTLVFDRRDVAV